MKKHNNKQTRMITANKVKDVAEFIDETVDNSQFIELLYQL